MTARQLRRVGPLGPVAVPNPADPQPWMAFALCAETDPEAFFPEHGRSARQAKAVCRACEVRVQCLEYALRNDERFGVWGGTSELDRRQLRTQRRREVAT